MLLSAPFSESAYFDEVDTRLHIKTAEMHTCKGILVVILISEVKQIVMSHFKIVLLVYHSYYHQTKQKSGLCNWQRELCPRTNQPQRIKCPTASHSGPRNLATHFKASNGL